MNYFAAETRNSAINEAQISLDKAKAALADKDYIEKHHLNVETLKRGVMTSERLLANYKLMAKVAPMILYLYEGLSQSFELDLIAEYNAVTSDMTTSELESVNPTKVFNQIIAKIQPQVTVYRAAAVQGFDYEGDIVNGMVSFGTTVELLDKLYYVRAYFDVKDVEACTTVHDSPKYGKVYNTDYGMLNWDAPKLISIKEV